MKETIKKGDIVKKATMIYLVDDFYKENKEYILVSKNCISTKKQHKRGTNVTKKFYEHQVDSIKQASQAEKELLLNNNNTCEIHLSEDECITFLKEKKYLIYKQI